jgi:hypothetical protein
VLIDGGPPASSYTVIIDDHPDVFDGLMITLAMFTLNIFHPGIYLRDPSNLSTTSPEGVILDDVPKTSPPLMRDRSSSVSRHARAQAIPSPAYGPR